jgi:hypothetical protein
MEKLEKMKKMKKWKDFFCGFFFDCKGVPPPVSQPHFEGSVRSPLTLPKMGLGNPPGVSKFQSSIVGVKTPRIGVFFIPLENS